MKRFTLRHITAVLLVGTGALALAAGCNDHPAHTPAASPTSPSTPTVPTVPPITEEAVFVGSAACAECHKTECNSQSHTRHALTLHIMSGKSLGRLAPPVGKIPGTSIVIATQNDGYVFTDPARSAQVVVPLNYVLGSGKSGVTYVSLANDTQLAERNDTQLAEMHESYFPKEKRWYVTPGQEKLPGNSPGMLHPRDFSRACILCHAVTLPSNSLIPEARFMGVRCERCHGPGSTHIAAMHAGKFDADPMEKMESWNGDRISDLCGECHGSVQNIGQSPILRKATNRFQPYGLSLSPCFQQSKGVLTCVTCHDPHTDVRTDLKFYETICLTCHSASTAAKRPPQLRTVTIKPCPVNPKTGCIGCHMPNRNAISDSKIVIPMADHYIRVRK